jgi:oligosaccharide repeat unit polymerase
VPSGKNLFFHKQRIVYFFAPLSIVLLIFYIFLIENAPSLSQSPLLLLISFLPKAMIIVSLYIYIKSNNKYFLYLFLILIFLSFAESSRRIYITIFFILLPLIISYIYQRHGKISFIHKLNFSIVLIIFFIFLNFLRSSHDFGEGYEEDSEILNTINYIQNMRSIDTFYNTSFIIENFPNNYNYYYGETYFAALVMFIPRSIWNEKPVSFAAPLGVLQRLDTQDFTFEDWNSINQFSLSPGFIGEAWANFGILGVIILSALFGAFTRIIDNTVNIIDIVRNINLLPYLSYYGAAFILLRGDFFSAVYFTIFFYIYLKLLVKFGTFRA